MVRSVFHCQHPRHEGDRLVKHPKDRIIVSLDFMTQGSKERIHRIDAQHAVTVNNLPIGPGHICRHCMGEWIGDHKATELDGQEPLPI